MTVHGIVTENSAARLVRLITLADGSYPTAADISAISVKSFDCDSDDLVKSGTITVSASTVLPTPRTDDARYLDADGYNLVLDLDGGYWPDAGQVTVEAKVSPQSGNPIYVTWLLQVEKVLSE